jgi:hypothetical protein
LYTAIDTQNLTSATGAIAVTDGEAVTPLAANADYTITATPTIADGRDGQLAMLVNTGSHTITLQDMGTLGGSNLRLAATTRSLAPNCGVLELVFDAAMGGWVETEFVNVLAFVPAVGGFTLDGGTGLVREVAASSTVDAVPTFTVSYVGVPKAASINVDGGEVVGTDYPISLPANYTALSASTTPPSKAFYKGSAVGSVRAFTVTASVSSVVGLTRTCTVTYLNSRYGGVNAQGTALSSAQVVALGALAIDNNLYGSFNANATTGSYLWYCHRAALGQVANFAINGERTVFTRIGDGTASVTNASGFTENFEQYRSAVSGLGNVTVTAQGGLPPNRVYLLKSTNTTAATLTDAEINAAATSALQDSIALNPGTRPVTGPGEYLWYMFPARLTYNTITFYVGSQLPGGMDGAGTGGTTFTHVNQWGYSESYRAFRSDNANLGTLSSWSCAVT